MRRTTAPLIDATAAVREPLAAEGQRPTTAWRAVVTILAAASLAATPAWAQSGAAATGGRLARSEAAIIARVLAPAPLRHAIDAEARRHAAALGQTASGSSRAGSCVKRVTLFTLLGTGVSLVAAGVLLASTGGSDDTNGILTKWGVAGALSGAAVGAITCAAP
jgi:hypothetical protein